MEGAKEYHKYPGPAAPHDDDDDELHILVVVFSTWRQMADRLPREGRKNATKPAHAVPLASARQHLGVETQAGRSSERAVEGPRRHMTPLAGGRFFPPGFSHTIRLGQSASLCAPKEDRVSHGASFLAPGSLARRRLARVINHHHKNTS